MTTAKVRPGDVIQPISRRIPKARHAVVIRVYTGGGDGVRAVPDTSPWYERIISNLLCNTMRELEEHQADVWKDSVQVYPAEFKAVWTTARERGLK